MSEFLVVSSTFAREPLLAILLVVGLLVAFGALLLRLNGIAFGEPRGAGRAGEGLLRADVRPSRAGALRRHLPAGAAGRVVPARRAAAWDRRAMTTLSASDRKRLRRSRPPSPGRARIDDASWEQASQQLADGALTLLGLWGDGDRVHMALLDAAAGGFGDRLTLACPDGRFPSVGRLHRAGDPAGTRDPRSVRA